MKKKSVFYMLFFLCFAFLILIACTQTTPDNMFGTLRVSKINPRYFTDDRGGAVYLTGSHTWNNLVDMGPGDIPEEFDFVAYIQWMKKYNHNFIRLWTWELLNWDTQSNREIVVKDHRVAPHPWARMGPGNALDGLPKFDLNKWDPEYFNRLKYRVNYAADNGIYVSIMLFEGWGLQFSPNAFQNHPFHPENNINAINADLDGDGMGLEMHTLVNEEINAIQKKYVKKVIDTVNEFDNVLFEISNENHPPSTDWQYDMISFIKEYEKGLPKQHPVGMTFQYKGGSNQRLFDSPADWISPNPVGGYRDNPPPGDGSKVIMTDTDHLWGIGGDKVWVWKSFLRGLNPIYMDCYDANIIARNFDPDRADSLRKSLGYTLMFAQRMDLIHMTPEPDLASSTYCLANRGKEYLVYLPEDREVTIDLRDAPGPFQAQWFDIHTGEFVESVIVNGGDELTLTSPFTTVHAVLYLKLQ